MGKRIRVQRRGRGGRNWRASTHKRVAPAKYPAIAPKESFEASLSGKVEALMHDPGSGSPLSLLNSKMAYHVTRLSLKASPQGNKSATAEKLQLK